MSQSKNEHVADVRKEALRDKKSDESAPDTTSEKDTPMSIVGDSHDPDGSPKDVANDTDSNYGGIPNPFNLDALRAPPNFQQTGGVRKTILNVSAAPKPPKDKFIRVHPYDETYGQEAWCLNVVAFSHQFDGEIGAENFVVPAESDAYTLLFEKLKPVLIVCGITAAGSTFLWELTLPRPGDNRRASQWHETRLKCAKRAVQTWIRLESDIRAGGYNNAEPLSTIPEPDWGSEPFQTLFEVAYRDRIITSLDHPAVKEYLGN